MSTKTTPVQEVLNLVAKLSLTYSAEDYSEFLEDLIEELVNERECRKELDGDA